MRAVIATIGLPTCKAALGRESRSASYNNVGAGDEQTDATRVGDVPVSVSQSSLLEVASKDGVDGIGHTELGVHGDVPASDSQGSLFGVASKDGVGGIGHTELGVHVALSPSDCGMWPRQAKHQTVSCYCLEVMKVSDGGGGGWCDVGEPTSHQPVSSLRAVLHPITVQLAVHCRHADIA